MTHRCEHCKTQAPRYWYTLERRYYNGTRRGIVCQGCYMSSRYAVQAAGWAILPGIMAESRVNAGPITEDVIMQTKPAAQ